MQHTEHGENLKSREVLYALKTGVHKSRATKCGGT